VIRGYRFVLLLLLGVFISSCESTLEPALPVGAVPFDPPADYGVWWNEVEACSGLKGDFRSVQWYEMPGSTAFEYGGVRNIQGRWSPQGNTITLAERLMSDSMLVRHEELHALLHSGEHPALYFGTRCGALVYPG